MAGEVARVLPAATWTVFFLNEWVNEWLAVGASGRSEVPSEELKFLPVKCSVLGPVKSPGLDSSCVPRLQALPAQVFESGCSKCIRDCYHTDSNS